jgi:hypothetical protein
LPPLPPSEALERNAEERWMKKLVTIPNNLQRRKYESTEDARHKKEKEKQTLISDRRVERLTDDQTSRLPNNDKLRRPQAS